MEFDEDLSQELTFKDYLAILWRRKWLVVGTFVLVAGLGVFATTFMTPVFRTDGRLLVWDPSSNRNAAESRGPLGELQALSQPESVEVQLAVLQSGPFVKRVLQKAALPESARPVTVEATRVGETGLIDIAVESPDAKQAAGVANLMLDEYLRRSREMGHWQMNSAKQFVEAERARALQALTRAEQDLLAFRQQMGAGQLAAAQAGRTHGLLELEKRQQENAGALSRVAAQLGRIEAQLAREPEVKRVRVDRENPRREALESRLAELETQRATLRLEFRDHTPTIATINAQILQLKKNLAKEPERREIEQKIANPVYDELRARKMALERELLGLEAERDEILAQSASKHARIDQLGPWEVQLSNLAGRRDAAKKWFLAVDEKLRDINIRAQQGPPMARILERAEVPAAPVRPRKEKLWIMIALAGLALGIAAAIIPEYWGKGATAEGYDQSGYVEPPAATAHAPTGNHQKSAAHREKIWSASAGEKRDA